MPQELKISLRALYGRVHQAFFLRAGQCLFDKNAQIFHRFLAHAAVPMALFVPLVALPVRFGLRLRRLRERRLRNTQRVALMRAA